MAAASGSITPRMSLPLQQFVKEKGAVQDLSRYEQLKTGIRSEGPIADFINVLQIELLLPTKIALLIKNNLNDKPFVRETLSAYILDLKERRVISEKCAQYLYDKLGAESLEEIFESLSAILLYSQVQSQSNNRPLNRGLGEVFNLENTLIYSDRLSGLRRDQIQAELKKLQENREGTLLVEWLRAFNDSHAELSGELRNESWALLRRIDDGLTFRIEFLNFLQHLFSDPNLNSVEKICWKELHDELVKFPAETFRREAYLRVATERYYRQTLERVHAINESLQSLSPEAIYEMIKKCKSAYNGCIYLLQDHKNLPESSPTRFAYQVGIMRKEWLEINQTITRALGQPPHQFCSCEVESPPNQNQLTAWTFNEKPLIQFTPPQLAAFNAPPAIAPPAQNLQRTIAIIGCDWGGGHREVTRGAASTLTKLGYHPVTINLPDVMVSEDAIHNFFLTRWLGKDWTVASMFNGLLKEKAFALINFLRDMWKAPPAPDASERKLKMTLHQLMKVNPEMVITTYSHDNEEIIQAAKLLGIPCLHISTDIDSTIETRITPPDYNHFKMALPFTEEWMIKQIEQVTTPNQRTVLGPPVRQEFSQPRTHQDVINLKQKWGIDINKKVVIVSNGKNGAFSRYPELLAKHYASRAPQDIPVHMIVLCGNENYHYLNHLEKEVMAHTNLPASLFTSVPPEQMEELMTMAAEGGALVGKAGGATIFEAVTRGTRLLVDDVPAGPFAQGITHFFVYCIESILKYFGYKGQLAWEKVNTDFAINHGLADIITDEEEFIPKLEKVIQNNEPVKMDFKLENPQARLGQLVGEMISEAERDPALRGQRWAMQRV